MIYTVTLNPSLDYVMECGGIKEGELTRSVKESFFTGGKGINVSSMLTNLGIENTAVAFAAGFTGRYLEETVSPLQKTKFIYIKDGYTRINVKIKGKTETEVNGAGPEADENALNELFDFLKSLTNKDLVVISGSEIRSKQGGIYERTAAILSKSGVSFVADTYGNSLKSVLKYRPFLIKPNRAELEEIFDKKADSIYKIAEMAAQLQKMGAQNVLVSMGGEGAVIVCKDGNVYSSPAPKGEKINAVGAGDSMVAGFLAEYIKSCDYKKAFYMAVSSGSATAFSEGIAKRSDVIKIFEELYKE